MRKYPHNNNYYVTREGDVWSVRYAKFLKPTVDRNGYHKLELSGKMYKRLHQIVAETYLPNPHGLPQVNHIDEDKSNNKVENLEWVDAQRNSEHSKAKVWLIEEMSTGRVFEVYNLRKWMRETGVSGDIYKTHPSGTPVSSKGYRRYC